MSSKTFVVKSFKIDTDESEIFWEGSKFTSYGHLLCLGDHERFIVYFLDKQNKAPESSYIPEYNLGAIFVNAEEKDSYVSLMRTTEPVYVHMNKEKPEWNSISVSEPIREEIY